MRPFFLHSVEIGIRAFAGMQATKLSPFLNIRRRKVWLFTGGLLLISVAGFCLDTGPLDFSLPPTPFPWSLACFFAALLALAIAFILYILRIVLGDKTVKLSGEKRKIIEKGFAEKLSSDFRQKDEALKQGMKDLRTRFSMVFMKVRNLTSSLDPDEIFKAIIDLIAQEADASKFILFLYDRTKNELYSFKSHGYPGDKTPSYSIPVGTPHFITHAFNKRQVIAKTRSMDDPETRGLVNREPLTNTLVALPIATEKEALGVIHIEAFSKTHEGVNDDDLRFFASLSTFMGMALTNANILLQTRDELTSTRKITEKELQEKKHLKEVFSKYASAALVDNLLQNPGSVRLGGSQKEASILFSDIAGFTFFSSKLQPAEVVATMNEYLSVMCEVVMNNEGEIDKFIGDAVMARFGVLIDLPSPGLSAVKTALGMMEALKKLHARWGLEKRECFNIRIGIASGPVLAGNIGSERRQEFTVMGSTVNLASRLETLNKELKTTILIDETTYKQIFREIRAVSRENISVRGFENNITVYEVLGYHQQVQPKSNVINLRSKIPSNNANNVIPEGSKAPVSTPELPESEESPKQPGVASKGEKKDDT